MSDRIIGEVCVCGALKEEHSHMTTRVEDRDVIAETHGGGCGRTSCPQFTWNGWQTDGNAAVAAASQAAVSV